MIENGECGKEVVLANFNVLVTPLHWPAETKRKSSGYGSQLTRPIFEPTAFD
jgi:hypothetical protein